MTLEKKLAEIKRLSEEIKKDEIECGTKTTVFSWVIGIVFGVVIGYIIYTL